MKLLFDENLSYKLCQRLEDIFPNSQHVKYLHLEQVDDTKIWDFAKNKNFVIVTQDADFNEFSIIKGFPPYVIWLRTGHSRLIDIEAVLRKFYIKIREVIDGQKYGIIEIDR